MKKPKIAILTIRNSYKFGGVFTSVKNLYNFFQKYFDPTVFYLSFDPKISVNIKKLNFKNKIRKTNYFGMNAIEIGSRWAFWEPGHYVYSLPLWHKALQDYDYLFVESGTNIAAYPLTFLNKKFIVCFAASYADDRKQRITRLPFQRKLIDFFAQLKMNKIEKEIFKRADYLFPISEDTKNSIYKSLKCKRDNIAVCGFPISLKVNKKRLSSNKNIIAVGRFSDPRKNIDMLMRAFQNIYKKQSESKLYIVGKKPQEDILDKYSNFDFYKNIIFTGMLEVNELNQFYEIADLMLITSYQEGLGIIGLEAMSYGLPVVATDCGGTKDYIVNGMNGYLVDIDDDYNMAKRALEILSSEDLYNKFSDFALTFVRDNYSQSRFESIVKYGLIKAYPELKSLFEKMDNKNELTSTKKFEEINL